MLGQKRVAEWIGKIFFPSNLIISASVILLFYFYLRGDPNFMDNLTTFMLTLFPSYAGLYFLRRSVQNDNLLYLGGTIIASVFFFLCTMFTTLSDQFAYFAHVLFSTMLPFSLMRLKWKISGHVTVATFVSTTFTLIDWRLFFFYVLSPILAWSRLKLKAHSPLQILVGALLGFITPTICLLLIHPSIIG